MISILCHGRARGRSSTIAKLLATLLILAGCSLAPQRQPAATPVSSLPLAPSPTVADAGAPAPGSQPRVQIDTTQDYRALGYTDQRKLARDSRGTLYAAYRKKGAPGDRECYHIFVSKSSDNGSTWRVVPGGAPIEQTDDCMQRVPSLIVDASDVIHVVWYGRDKQHNRDNDRQIKYTRSTDGGSTWSGWRNVAEVSGYSGSALWQEHPTIAASGKLLYIVWQGLDGEGSDTSQAKFIRSSDGGTTWSAWRNAGAGRKNQSRPVLVAARDGRLFLFAYGNLGGVQQIIWTTSVDHGDAWQPWRAVAPDDADQRHVSAATDASARIHLVWRQMDGLDGSTIRYAVYDGKSWSAAASVGAAPGVYQFFPSVVVSGSGTLWVAWTEANERSDAPEDDPTAGQIVYVSKPAGSRWRPRTTLTPRSRTSIYVSLYANPDDQRTTVDAIWLDNSDGVRKGIWYARLDGRTMLADGAYAGAALCGGEVRRVKPPRTPPPRNSCHLGSTMPTKRNAVDRSHYSTAA
jgi:hypothetical protein